MTAPFCWEDIVVGAVERSGFYALADDEIVDFAERYDPLPIHVDRVAADASPFGGLIAAGGHMLAIRQRLLHDFPYATGVIASIGHDDVRFLAPLRGGSRCQVEVEWLEKHETSKPARGVGIARITLFADDVAVLSLKDLVLIRRRGG